MSLSAENTPELFQLADQAMRAELTLSACAKMSDKWSERPSEPILRLAEADSRFRQWPEDFARSHGLMHVISHYYDQTYWRVNTGRLPLHINPTLPKDEQLATAGLAEVLLLTRVNVEVTENTDYPQAPTPEGMEAEWEAVHRELGGDPEDLLSLPNTTWTGLVQGLIDGRVRVGYED